MSAAEECCDVANETVSSNDIKTVMGSALGVRRFLTRDLNEQSQHEQCFEEPEKKEHSLVYEFVLELKEDGRLRRKKLNELFFNGNQNTLSAATKMMKSRKRKKREMKEMRHRIANNRAMNAVKIGCNIGLSGTESLVSAADPVVITEKPSLAKIKTVSRKRNADKVEDDKNLALFQKLTISSTNWEKLIEPSIECSSNGFISWSVFVRSYMQVSRVFINNVRNSFSLNFYEKLDTFASMDQISEDLKGCMLKTREEMITELEKNNLISLFNSNALAQLIVSELAALKSLIMNNFIRILTCDIARQLSSEFVEVNSNYADRVAAALVYFILGSGTKVDVGSGNSNEDEDSVQSTPVSLDCVVLPLDTFFGRWKPGTAAHKTMISYFREGSFTRKTLIRRYVPVVLRALISDTRSGWLENIKTND